MRNVIAAMLVATAAMACTREDPARATVGTTSVTGIVVERLDGPPYSFLLLDTGDGNVWAAVPMTAATKGGRVTVVNGATVKGFEARSLGRRFESVVFGVVERK